MSGHEFSKEHKNLIYYFGLFSFRRNVNWNIFIFSFPLYAYDRSLIEIMKTQITAVYITVLFMIPESDVTAMAFWIPRLPECTDPSVRIRTAALCRPKAGRLAPMGRSTARTPTSGRFDLPTPVQGSRADKTAALDPSSRPKNTQGSQSKDFSLLQPDRKNTSTKVPSSREKIPASRTARLWVYRTTTSLTEVRHRMQTSPPFRYDTE